ncbi:AtpZ/AtpI family protein [Ectobacillus sp. sgz5001026]|uniref:AtpZ/AtpI family protein n=1 Tax=Ectobacillus sp. sgz5001026 TaxID=3242473 RepID=UPI0036D36477
MQGNNKNPMKAYALMTGVLSSLAGSILVGIFGGKWLDSLFGTFPLFLIIGLLLGLGAGVYAMTKLISQFYAGDE